VTRWYLDTSAALKLIVVERESAALVEAIEAEQVYPVSCLLLETELRRAVQRIPGLTQQVANELLSRVDLYALPASLYREAGLLTGANLRSLDALHVAAAIRLGVDQVVTYDTRMAEAAREAGLSVTAPA
jgi:predicted nucleic acid-binding protein